jgi:hypothetical protein
VGKKLKVKAVTRIILKWIFKNCVEGDTGLIWFRISQFTGFFELGYETLYSKKVRFYDKLKDALQLVNWLAYQCCQLGFRV